MKTLALILFLFPLSMIAQKPHYVLAPSGLNMRATSNPSSAKIQTVPVGAEVEWLEAPASKDMEIDGLDGGMAKVKYQGKVGYMFSGYLSKYPAPKPYMGTEKYVEKLRLLTLSYTYEECRVDHDGHISVDETFYISEIDWQTAYLVAWRLYEFPKSLRFPGLHGPAGKTKTIPNPKPHEYAWSDEMTVKWNGAGSLEEISYYYRGEGSGVSVQITVDGDSRLKVTYGQVAD